MDLFTLALAMKNGGGGGGGAPMIVPGVLTEVDGYVEVEIETELADIYAAAEAGRAVFLEWADDMEKTRLELIHREIGVNEQIHVEWYNLSFGAALFVNGTPAIITATFDGESTGLLDVVLMTDVKYDIEIRHDYDNDTWEANEYDLDALQAKPTPISVRAIEADGYLRNYFVYQVIVQAAGVEVVLLDMDPATSAQDQVIRLAVFPDGRVIKQ